MLANLPVTIEVDMEKVLEGLLEDFDNEDMVNFVEEMIDRTGDQDLMNSIYEMLRSKHQEYLEAMGISEDEYKTDYAEPGIYDEGIEVSVAEEEEVEDEAWSTEDPDAILEEENIMDVFTTEDDK